jgi:hypothetical protein
MPPAPRKRGAKNPAPARNQRISKDFALDGVKVGLESYRLDMMAFRRAVVIARNKNSIDMIYNKAQIASSKTTILLGILWSI